MFHESPFQSLFLWIEAVWWFPSAFPLNQERFLSDMDTSLQALRQQQQDLLQSLSSTRANNNQPITKQDQIHRQYQPFAQLARYAQAQNQKYAVEIAALQSTPAPVLYQAKTGLAKPTQALAVLGVALTGALLLLVAGTTVDVVQDILTSTTSNTVIAKEEPTTSIVTSPVVVWQESVSSSSYALKDFGKLDFYGSSASVDAWFNNH